MEEYRVLAHSKGKHDGRQPRLGRPRRLFQQERDIAFIPGAELDSQLLSN